MTTPTINTVIEPHPDVVDLTTSFAPPYYEPENTPPAMQTPIMPDTPIKKECFACPPYKLRPLRHFSEVRYDVCTQTCKRVESDPSS